MDAIVADTLGTFSHMALLSQHQSGSMAEISALLLRTKQTATAQMISQSFKDTLKAVVPGSQPPAVVASASRWGTGALTLSTVGLVVFVSSTLPLGEMMKFVTVQMG